jgi:hypothetical protein
MTIDISICPTSLEYNNGDVYDADALLDAMRAFILDAHPDARIACLQIGYQQGDEWAAVDGDDQAGADLVADFFAAHGADEELYVSRTPDSVTARLEERKVEGTGWYVYVDGQDAGGPFETEADALSAWQTRS